MQHFKHLLLSTALIPFAFAAQAHEITIALGGLSSTLNSEQNFGRSAQSTDEGSHSAGTHTALGGEASLAYIWNVNSGFDLGFEFYYDFVGGLQVEGTTGMIDTVNTMFGARALPGFKITDNTKIYINLGYGIIDQTLDISNTHPTDFSQTSMDFSNKGGFQYGAGVETMIYNNIGIRLAYTVQQNSEVTFESDGNKYYFTDTATVYNFFFGATYHFKWG